MPTATAPNLDRLRNIIDRIEEQNRSLAELRAEKSEIEHDIRAYCDATGMSQLGNVRLTITVRDELVANYDPAEWTNIVEWAARTGNTHIVQRRLSTKPVLELIDTGTQLPDGLSVESITRINVRRK